MIIITIITIIALEQSHHVPHINTQSRDHDNKLHSLIYQLYIIPQKWDQFYGILSNYSTNYNSRHGSALKLQRKNYTLISTAQYNLI